MFVHHRIMELGSVIKVKPGVTRGPLRRKYGRTDSPYNLRVITPFRIAALIQDCHCDVDRLGKGIRWPCIASGQLVSLFVYLSENDRYIKDER